MGLLDQIGTAFNEGKFDLAMGLLSASGPSIQPRGFGQVFSEAAQFASERDRSRMQNQFIRDRMEADKRKREAIKQLPSLLNAPTAETASAGSGMFRAGADRQSQVMGLLADAAPEQMAQGLLSQFMPTKSKEFEKIAILKAADIDPKSEEGRAFLLSDDNQLQDILARLDIEDRLNDREESRNIKKRSKTAVVDTFSNTLHRAKKLLESNNALEGSFLESGTTFTDARKALLSGAAEIKDIFGKDTKEDRKVMTEYNTFQKQAAGFAIDLIDSLEGATNSKFSTLKSSLANIGVDPQTNRRIIGEVITKAVQEAQRAGIDIPESDLKMANELLQKIGSSEQLYQETGRGQVMQNFNLPEGFNLEFLD